MVGDFLRYLFISLSINLGILKNYLGKHKNGEIIKSHLHELYEHKELLIFAGGIATAIIGKQLLKSETVKKTSTKAMAKVLATKKEAEECFQDMKDNAEDIVEDSTKKEKIYAEEVEIEE